MALWVGARLAGRCQRPSSQRLSLRAFGLLKVGEPLSWEENLPNNRYVREHGLRQFLETYRRVMHLSNDRLFYGDEIEHAILKLDDEHRNVRLSLRSAELLDELREKEQNSESLSGDSCTWHQEYGSWMLEGTPALPYGGYTSSLLQMEKNMRLRRSRLLAALKPNEIAPTVVNFPLMGVGEFTDPPAPPGGAFSKSDSVPDSVINGHPRFGTLTSNIRSRRGSKVDIRIPQYKDAKTALVDGKVPDLHGDAMAYGMGCCCLQVTFQASDIDEARYLYDQLNPLAPIMMALTAATPIFRGHLANVEVRWSAVSASVDDRTPAERSESGADMTPDPRMAGQGIRHLNKSRYDSISTYLNTASPTFNDVPCETEEEFKDMLMKEGRIDGILANHLAHLFVRDPLVQFDGAVTEVDDKTSVEHFDSINSTNWQTVRFKPPPLQQADAPHVGWRTEFRSMEVQLTDFENAAFSAFIVLLTRVLLVFDLDILVPLSKVDENMQRAHSLDAITSEKFWFRNRVLPARKAVDSTEEMTMGEIMNGKGQEFPGLVPLCYAYLELIQCDPTSFAHIDKYLTFIQKRADGELQTPAKWMRNFVREHPEYKQDSVVTQGIAYDLMKACDEIGRGVRQCPEILGEVTIKPITAQGAYGTALKSFSSQEARATLLRKLMDRAAPDDRAGSLPHAPRRRHTRM